MTKAVYIPSHNRSDKAKALVKRLKIIFPKMPIHIIIDENQENDYAEVQTSIMTLSEIGKGIGYARKSCIDHAVSKGYKYILMLDDDSVVPDNIGKLMDNLIDHPEIGWSAGYLSFYGIMGIKPKTGLYYSYNMGSSIMAINIQYIISAGNFDERLYSKEDDDAKLKLLDFGCYISIDSDVVCGKTNGRWEEGGCSSFDVFDCEEKAEAILKEVWGEPYFGKRKRRTFIKWCKMNKSNFFKEINLSELPREAKPMITVTAKDIPEVLMTGKTMLAYPIPWQVATELGEKYEGIHYFDKMTKGLFFDEDSTVVTLENSMKVLATKKFSLMVFNEIPTQGRIEALSKSLEQNGVMLMPAPRSGKPATFTKMMKKINLKRSEEHTNNLFDAWVRA